MTRAGRARVWMLVLAMACGSDTGPAAPVASVSVSAVSGPLAAGATVRLSAVTRDANGTPLSGRVVTWASNATAIATVDGSGLVSGKSPGSARITATSEGKSGFTDVTIIAGPAARLVFATQPTTAVAGAPFVSAVSVAALDALGNPATAFVGAVGVAIGANPSGGTLGGTMSKAAVAGVATFDDLILDKAGAGYTLTTSSPGLTGATSNTFTVVAGGVSATLSGVVAAPASIPASGGASLSTVTVTARDSQGNPVAGAAVTLSATGLGNTVTQPAAPTNGAGVATGTLSSTVVGAKIVAASIAGIAVSQTDTVTVTPGAASGLVFIAQPTQVVAGAIITPAVQVEIRDAYGNRDTAATAGVTLAILANPSGGVLSGISTVSAIAGIASFADLSVDKAGAGYTLTASASGLASDTSSAFNVTVGGVSGLLSTIVASPTSITASAGNSSATITVTARDAQGNAIAGASVVLAATGAGNALIQPLGLTNAAGVATGSLSSTAVGMKVVSATIAGTAITQTDTITVSPAPAAALAFRVPPSDAVAGTVIAPAIEVEIRDAFGNLVSGATNSVTVAIQDNPSGGTLAGTKTAAAVSGVATFSTLSIDLAGTGYSLAASATGLGGATSTDFNITHGSATRLAYLVEPSQTIAGAAITPAVEVEILDAFGNRVSNASNNVTIALAANPGGGTLAGTKTSAAVAGVATFTSLSIDSAGAGYRLRATASGLTPDTSVAFAVTAGSATQLVFTVQPSTSVSTTPISPAVQVTARDAVGNVASSFVGQVTLAIGTNPGGGSLSGTATASAVNGVATFPGLSIDRAGSGYTLTAAASGVSGAASSAFNVTVGSATHLSFLVQPAGATGGATITPAVQVEALDAGGNRVTGTVFSVSLAIAANPGGGALTGTNPRNTVSGVASFTDLRIDKAGAGYTLAATATALTGTTSQPFDIGVGSAVRLAFFVQPTNTGGGATIAPAVQVEVQDSGGNRVTAGVHTIALAIGNNPGGGTLAGTTSQSSSSGLATFADLSVDNAGTGYTLSATATGLSLATSNSFDIVIGTAAQLGFFVQPSNTSGGVAINPAVVVEIQDAGGNRVATASNSVTIGIGSNPNSGTLSGTKTVPASAGLATFSTLALDSAGLGYTLTATASGLTGTASTAFNVTVGPAAKLGFRIQPSNTAGGSTISPAVQVEVRDAGGNRVGSANNSVTVAISTNPNNGSLAGTKTVAAVAGLASYSTLSIDSAGTGYRLGATATGLAAGTSSAFNVTVGVAARLAFLVEPSDAVAGSSITPAVQVEIRDAGGNRVTTASNSITLTLVANPGGSTLSGTNPKSASGGVATFTNLSLNKVGTGYTMRASAGALIQDTTAGFAIAADGVSGSLSSLVAATDTIGQCAYACAAGIQASLVTLTVKDQFGNLVPGAPVILSASGTGNGFSPAATGITDANGSFAAAFHSAVAEPKSISATAGGTAIAQTATSAVMPVLVGAGDIADCNSVRDDATANLLDSIPGVVFAAGDNAYPNGTATNFANCYDPTWGRHKARTRPVIGNHEYDSSGTAAAHVAYFDASVADPLGNGFGYYSFDVGTWHVIVLNSDSGVTNPGSGQLTWLQGDLVGRASQCVLAIWHRPLFTSGSSNGGSTRIRRLWQSLQDAGAEIVINGHDHLYERFAPQDSLGNATPGGIREFIVGTGGGETHSNYVNNPANVEASDNGMFSRGVLRLTLYAKAYRWEFLAAQGQGTYSDSGTSACH